jgi:hypothetical protein
MDMLEFVRYQFISKNSLKSVFMSKHVCAVQRWAKLLNSDEALNNEFLLKSNGNEALNDGFP